MKSGNSGTVLPDLQTLYDRAAGGRDLEFANILSASDSRNDTTLAELIEADGRFRIARGTPVSLERYLAAVPNLLMRADPLDAAIDVTLRSISGRARAHPESIEELIDKYPTLEAPIREAAALNAAVWSTTGLRQRVAVPPSKPLPCEFGPMTPASQRRYVLQKLLGQGSFGQVYLALDRQLSEADHTAMVAIKILMGGDRSAVARQRVIDEATKVRRISHPNVVMVIDRGVTEQDEDYIVYEYIDGGDLSDLTSGRPKLPIRDAVKLVSQIALGIHAAHAAGVIHCDLKPGNIMLTAAGVPKVADFGIAIRLTDDAASPDGDASSGRGPIGNIAFISPEQYRGEDGALSVPSDIYALGGILFLLLTGRLPNGATLEEIAEKHVRDGGRQLPPELTTHRPEVERDLAAICQRALAVNPEERYASAAALAEDLDRWLRREPLYWTNPNISRRVRLWAKRKPGLAVAVGFIVLLAVAGVTVAFFLNSLANKRAIDAAVNKLKVEQQDKEKQQQVAIIGAITGKLQLLQGYRFSTEALPVIWVLESALGGRVLGTPEVADQLWQTKLITLRKLVQAKHAEGRENDMETLLWESSLAFWLVRDKDYAEAEPLLAANFQKWQHMLESDDQWLVDLQAMMACAAVNRLLASSRDAAIDRDVLRSAETGLDALIVKVVPQQEGTPIHFMLLQSKIDLCGPTMLNEVERGQRLEKDLRTLIDATAGKTSKPAKRT